MTEKKIRHLHLVGATGQLRTAEYDGREHLVVPVVAMVEGVVWAVNSDVPEFVPAEELAETPQQWNGRGCFAGHPADGGTQVTANTPRTLEKSFGTVFDTSPSERILKTRRLELEAWLDPAKAEAVGPAAMSVIARLRAGQVVEVSVGCYVEPNDEDGTFNGKEYHGAWRNIVSDHLAFLAEGEQGACSVAAGCGAPRAATRHLVTTTKINGVDIVKLTVVDKDGKPVQEEPMTEKLGGLLTRIAARLKEGKTKSKADLTAMLALRDAEGLSDQDVRRAVDAALRAVEPGYMGIDAVYPDDGLVIYYVAPEDEWKMMRRSYTMTDGGVATLTEDAVEVEPVTTYEPITAAGAALQKPCGCGTRTAKESDMFTERIKKLMTSKHNTLKNEAALKLLTDGELKTLEEQAAAAEKAEQDAADKKAADDKAAADKKAADDAAAAEALKTSGAKPVMTRDEMLAAMPDVKVMLDERAAQDAAEHASLVTSLKAASSALTEEQLKAKPLAELRTLAAFAKVETPAADFSGRGAARLPAKAEDFTPPSAYDADLKALRGQKQTVN